MKKTIWAIIVVVIVIIAWFGISNNTKMEQEKEAIKIGSLLILSGESAVYGEGGKAGIELAVREYNDLNPSQKIEIIYEDTQGEAKGAVSGYQKLTKVDKVRAIIGPVFQTEVASILPLVKHDNVPVIALSPLPPTDRAGIKNPLAFWPDPTIESGKMADYVFGKGIKRVAVIGTVDSWEKEVSEGFANRFKEIGGEITAQELIFPTASDVKTAVTKIIATKPDAVYLGTYMKFIQLVKALKDLGYKGKIYSIEIDSYLANETKPLSDGLQFVSLSTYKGDFNQRIKELSGIEASIPAGQAYDATNIMISLLVNNKDNSDVIKDLQDFDIYEGVSGKVQFTSDGRAQFDTPIFELKGGVATEIAK